MKRPRLSAIAILLAGSVFLAACAPQATPTEEASPAPMLDSSSGQSSDAAGDQTAMQAELTIVETAEAAGSFSTLLAAVEAAGLTEALSTGSYTVLAPTDAAFAKLPAGTVEGLLEDPETLGEILKYHVIADEAPASVVAGLSTAETLQGESVSISAEAGQVMINDATVLQTDIMASNGIIHVIDTVLMPPSMQ